MNVFLNFQMEASLCILVSFLVYWVLFRKGTDFSFQRGYLLLAVLLSTFLPFIKVRGGESIPSMSHAVPFLLPEVSVGSGHQPSLTGPSTVAIWRMISMLYLGVTTLLLIRFLYRVAKLVVFLRSSPYSQPNNSRYRMVKTSGAAPAFSFFNYIVVNDSKILSSREMENIIRHELVHIQKLHSLDVLFMEVMTIVFWFNPAIHFIKRTLTDIHEFQADAIATEHVGKQEYCSLLAKISLQSNGFSIANHFNRSLTVKRIEMIKSVKRNINRWKIAGIAPVTAGLFFFVACQDQVKSVKQKAESVKIGYDNPSNIEIDGNTSKLSEGPKQDEEIYLVVEESARPKGNIVEFYKFVADNLKYPQEAIDRGISGKVFIEFIVNKDGSLTDLKILKGIGGGCDEEAIRVLSTAPQWNPARQYSKAVKQKMVLPIVFNLPENEPR